jgi:fumarylacetoacetate (FAA) hydrolase family protein
VLIFELLLERMDIDNANCILDQLITLYDENSFLLSLKAKLKMRVYSCRGASG